MAGSPWQLLVPSQVQVEPLLVEILPAGLRRAGSILRSSTSRAHPVVLHGIFAVTTVILVLLAALGVGGS
jgi:hypothetical protein